ncbi:DUF2267 domain-containing protein [Umezakia ovalisporum]|uniref:DUF2267 domain-containing protein n=1 Tax=Umezakia ovalisporum FSS-62 TaxID=2971776 RepID=A0AA43GY30_9CYAN|nr:DUF2267 domain-containing protein [Umezakia ovalisporum]MDH6063706.1 DUF2267 domain-containing protein [Umezakia ovalisporum FSS-62]
MEYERFLDAACELAFISDRETADAAVKAVLGILASKLDDRQALELSEGLPEPLNYERLHSHQIRKLPISAEEYIAVIREQFKLDDIQASQLIQQTLRITKEAVKDKMNEFTSRLPADWSALIEAA